jgi:hypothetical protein
MEKKISDDRNKLNENKIFSDIDKKVSFIKEETEKENIPEYNENIQVVNLIPDVKNDGELKKIKAGHEVDE